MMGRTIRANPPGIHSSPSACPTLSMRSCSPFSLIVRLLAYNPVLLSIARYGSAR
jgi:hypothetical protein